MDSEDERILRDADERGGISGLHRKDSPNSIPSCGISGSLFMIVIDPDVEFRLYENKEGRLVRKRLRGSKHGLDSAEPDPAFVIRLHRFFHTLRGFHKVGLFSSMLNACMTVSVYSVIYCYVGKAGPQRPSRAKVQVPLDSLENLLFRHQEAFCARRTLSIPFAR